MRYIALCSHEHKSRGESEKGLLYLYTHFSLSPLEKYTIKFINMDLYAIIIL